MRKIILRLLVPKVCQINDVVLARDGTAWWVQPGRLVQMRVIRLGEKIKSTEESK